MSRCPGFSFDAMRHMDDDEYNRICATGTASEYHRVAAHPHAFCGCGNDADDCHPGRCCRDNEYGECTNCGKPEPEPPVEVTPESELSDPLFALDGA